MKMLKAMWDQAKAARAIQQLITPESFVKLDRRLTEKWLDMARDGAFPTKLAAMQGRATMSQIVLKQLLAMKEAQSK